MNTSYFAARLAPLASAAVQEAYGLHASLDSYVVPSELLEAASECVAKANGAHPVALGLSEPARQRFGGLEAAINAQAASSLGEQSWSELLKSPSWLRVRSAAGAVLAELNFNLAEWEANECHIRPVP